MRGVSRPQHVDPPDLGLVQTARGLSRLWRAEWRLVTGGLVCALHLQRALAGDSDRHPARDRQLDRTEERPPATRSGRISSRSAARRDPLRDQLHAPLCDGAHRHPRRGAHARAPLPGLPALPARVLRPARDRAGRLTRDERPLSDPLLHRLGPDPGRAVADDDRRHQRRAVPGERQAGGDRHLHDAARRHPHVQLRAQGDADLAARAAAVART